MSVLSSPVTGLGERRRPVAAVQDVDGSPRDRIAAAAAALAGPADADGRRAWAALARAGVLRDLFAAGRHEPDLGVLEVLLDKLDRALPVGVVLSVCVQAASVVPLLHRLGETSPLAADLAQRMLAGGSVVALAVTDADVSGSVLLDCRTHLDGGGADGAAILHGAKAWITNAGLCDWALVLTRSRPPRHFTSFRWVLVPVTSPGVRVEVEGGGLFAGAGVGTLRFDGVRLDPASLVGRPGRALAELSQHLRTERVAGALWARSMCRHALRDTLDDLRARMIDGSSAWENAAIRAKYAQALVDWRWLNAAVRVTTAEPASATEVVALKAAYPGVVDRVLGACVELLGAAAFAGPNLALRRAQAAMFASAGGAAGAMLAVVADRADELLDAVPPGPGASGGSGARP